MDQPSFDVPESGASKNKKIVIIVIVALLVLCCCCAAIGILGWNYGDQLLGL